MPFTIIIIIRMLQSTSLYICATLILVIGELYALPATLLSKEKSNWFNLFAEDGSIRRNELEKFPLYEYVYEKHIYGNQIWSDCSKSSDLVQIQSVYIDPSPPQRGETLTVTATVTLTEQISSGSVKILIKYKNYIPVVSKTLSICDLASYLGESCPLSAGTHTVTTTEVFPSYAPSGQYVGKVVAKDSYGNELVCISLDMTVS